MEEIKTGTFKSDLMRTFKQLKESRAENVAEDVETSYKRRIEDLVREIRKCERSRDEIMLALAPETAISNAVVPADFNPENFIGKDLEIGIKLREAIIKLEILATRYEVLFGPVPELAAIMKYVPTFKSKYAE